MPLVGSRPSGKPGSCLNKSDEARNDEVMLFSPSTNINGDAERLTRKNHLSNELWILMLNMNNERTMILHRRRWANDRSIWHFTECLLQWWCNFLIEMIDGHRGNVAQFLQHFVCAQWTLINTVFVRCGHIDGRYYSQYFEHLIDDLCKNNKKKANASSSTNFQIPTSSVNNDSCTLPGMKQHKLTSMYLL